MFESLQQKGYDVYVDRFYNSPLLALELLKLGFTVTGTVQSNCKGLPAAKRKKSKADKGIHHRISCWQTHGTGLDGQTESPHAFYQAHKGHTAGDIEKVQAHAHTHAHTHAHKATHTDACNVDVYVHLFACLLLHKQYMNTHMHTQIVQTFTQAT